MRGQVTRYSHIDTAIGVVAVAWNDRGVVRVEIAEPSARAAAEKLARHCGEVRPARPTPDIARLLRQIERHLGGAPTPLDAELDWRQVSDFRRAVYERLREVPAGATVSYAELAGRAGAPNAARAVGRAMAINPFPLIVPCHRVLGKNGAGGFSAAGGMATKQKLLALEGISLDPALGAERARPGDPLPFDRRAAEQALRRADPELGAWIRKVGRLRIAVEPPASTFAALAEAIVYQQLTGKAAATIFGRLRARLCNGRALRAADVAGAADEQLRAVGLSRGKSAALRDLADNTLARRVPTLHRLRDLDDEAIVAALTPIRGIGRWTVQMLLMFKLGRPDVLPLDDYGLKKGFARVFGLAELPKPAAVAARGERWRPYRTAASWYLWRAAE